MFPILCTAPILHVHATRAIYWCLIAPIEMSAGLGCHIGAGARYSICGLKVKALKLRPLTLTLVVIIQS